MITLTLSSRESYKSWPSRGPRSASVIFVGDGLVFICFFKYFDHFIRLMLFAPSTGVYAGGQLTLRTDYSKVWRRSTQDNFSGVRVNQSEYFRADGAEPIVNDIMKIVGGTKESGQFGPGKAEAKELAADVIIETGAASRVGTLHNHFRPVLSSDHLDGDFDENVGSSPFALTPSLSQCT